MGSLQQLAEPAALLRCSLSSLEGLRQLPWLTRVFSSRTFRGQKTMVAPPLQWLGQRWDVQLASVGDTIYIVGLSAVASNQTSAEALPAAVYSRIERELGSPSRAASKLFAWDADDGNVVLRLHNHRGGWLVVVLFTSSVIRTFARA